MNIIDVPSPNFHSGRRGFFPEAIVIHIMEGSLSGTDSWFGSMISQVSAHYGIGRSGQIHQYVQEADTAFHAGRVNAPSWSLIKQSGNAFINPNFYTIGIEHEGGDDTDWTDAMYNTSSALIRDISSRWGIPLDRQHVIGHHEIYSLKTCPGHKVDINKLIALAAGIDYVPAGNGNQTRIPAPGNAVSIARLNIRSTPDTNMAPLGTVEPGTNLSYDGYTEEGQPVNGNSKWFYTSEEEWFWSGGVVISATGQQ